MKVIHQVHPDDFTGYNTKQIRSRFLLENLVVADHIECAYSHYDRMIVGAANPVNQALELGTYEFGCILPDLVIMFLVNS